MEPLKYFKEYVREFQQLNFNDFSGIYRSLYSNYENMQDRIEFSLLINPENRFDLRFGLFKIYNTQKISSLFKRIGYGTSDLEKILYSARNFVPEFAVGFDFNTKNPRIKVYFLRLPDNAEFNKDPLKKIKTLSGLINIDMMAVDQEELTGCYLIAMDFYRTNKQNMKIYTREKNVDFSKINNCLKGKGITSQYLWVFQELFSNRELKDTTISKKYPANQNNPISLSVFFEVGNNLNWMIEQLIKICIPEKFIDLKKILKTLERNQQVRYSHIGLTFHEDETKESICLYFSPMFEDIKK